MPSQATCASDVLPHRFNTSVDFGLPDEACRAQILHQYAKHLSKEEVASVAGALPGMAGRDLKDISEQAERRWASKVLVPDQVHSGPLTTLIQVYCKVAPTCSVKCPALGDGALFLLLPGGLDMLHDNPVAFNICSQCTGLILRWDWPLWSVTAL